MTFFVKHKIRLFIIRGEEGFREIHVFFSRKKQGNVARKLKELSKLNKTCFTLSCCERYKVAQQPAIHYIFKSLT